MQFSADMIDRWEPMEPAAVLARCHTLCLLGHARVCQRVPLLPMSQLPHSSSTGWHVPRCWQPWVQACHATHVQRLRSSRFLSLGSGARTCRVCDEILSAIPAPLASSLFTFDWVRSD